MAAAGVLPAAAVDPAAGTAAAGVPPAVDNAAAAAAPVVVPPVVGAGCPADCHHAEGWGGCAANNRCACILGRGGPSCDFNLQSILHSQNVYAGFKESPFFRPLDLQGWSPAASVSPPQCTPAGDSPPRCKFLLPAVATSPVERRAARAGLPDNHLPPAPLPLPLSCTRDYWRRRRR